MALWITLFLGLFFLSVMILIKFFPNHELIEHISYAIAFGSMAGIVVLDLLPRFLKPSNRPVTRWPRF